MVPASAEEPPPSRGALTGTAKAPALTTCASVIVAFGRDSEANRSQAAGGCVLWAAAAGGTSISISTKVERMATPIVPRLYSIGAPEALRVEWVAYVSTSQRTALSTK